MTREDMLKEIGDRELTPKLALEISIKKWKALKYISISRKNRHRYDSIYPTIRNCALCEYYRGYTDKIGNQSMCPLYLIDHCCSSNYSFIMRAKNGFEFRHYKSLLIKEMKVALNELK